MKRILESDDYPPLEHISDIRTSLKRAAIEDFILSSEELHKIALLLSSAERYVPISAEDRHSIRRSGRLLSPFRSTSSRVQYQTGD